jgi:hypothetical protein
MRGSRIDDNPRINVCSIAAVAHDWTGTLGGATFDPLREPAPAAEPDDERREEGMMRLSI